MSNLRSGALALLLALSLSACYMRTDSRNIRSTPSPTHAMSTPTPTATQDIIINPGDKRMKP